MYNIECECECECEKILEYRFILVPQDRKARARPASCQLPLVKTCKTGSAKKKKFFFSLTGSEARPFDRESALAVSTVVGLVCLRPCQACRALLIDR